MEQADTAGSDVDEATLCEDRAGLDEKSNYAALEKKGRE